MQNFFDIFWGSPVKGNMPFIEGIISFSKWWNPNYEKEKYDNEQLHEWLNVASVWSEVHAVIVWLDTINTLIINSDNTHN